MSTFKIFVFSISKCKYIVVVVLLECVNVIVLGVISKSKCLVVLKLKLMLFFKDNLAATCCYFLL